MICPTEKKIEDILRIRNEKFYDLFLVGIQNADNVVESRENIARLIDQCFTYIGGQMSGNRTKNILENALAARIAAANTNHHHVPNPVNAGAGGGGGGSSSSPSPSAPETTPASPPTSPSSPTPPPPVSPSVDDAQEILETAKKVQAETNASLEEIKKATDNLNHLIESSKEQEQQI